MIIAPLLALLAVGAPPPADTARFQQGVDYRIEARLDEATHVLHGRARLRYVNHSPATLDTLWLHQYLNAFRPNSDWARRELLFGERRFQDLGPEDHAYSRFTGVEIGGRAVRPVYPGAPDSTVVALPLPAPLRPGDSVVMRMDWDARLATEPRRQGRRGRHYDFAQWYPRIAVHDTAGWEAHPLLPQGEFYGEFASYDVTLDVAADQVIGATGVPVAGDPGWAEAAAAGTGTIRYDRSAYAPRMMEALGLLDGQPAPGRKRVRWRAEDVHDFAWSIDPAFIYEQGSAPRPGAHGDSITVHVLYQPGDTAWGGGVAVAHTDSALAWLQATLGPYVWPQFTVLHRIEGGGTEFPMLIMTGSASTSLIAHETAHQWAFGMLANNQWRASWLDEGLASFLASWYLEDHGTRGRWAALIDREREWERAGATQPVAQPAEDFRDMATYDVMSYNKTAIVLYMLREMVGADTMRAILQRYYQENVLHHVTEADLRRAVNEVTGEDYGWFFDEWLHTTDVLDYAIAGASTRQASDGRWRTTVRVRRRGGIWMPVTLQVDGATRNLTSHDREQTVEVITVARPTEVVLDPGGVLLDVDPGNDRVGL